MSPERIKQNDQYLSRLSARREVRRLRQNKKKVPPELLAKSGFQDGLPLTDRRVLKVAKTVTTRSGPVVVLVKGRQAQAKALGIKNRRWMTAVELDKAIRYATSCKGNRLIADGVMLASLEQRGRERCRVAWEAWKRKQP